MNNNRIRANASHFSASKSFTGYTASPSYPVAVVTGALHVLNKLLMSSISSAVNNKSLRSLIALESVKQPANVRAMLVSHVPQRLLITLILKNDTIFVLRL